MAEKKAVDVDRATATPLEAGEPVEAPAVSQMGSTFAERAKAREKTAKQVKDADVEDKAIASSETKKRNPRKS